LSFTYWVHDETCEHVYDSGYVGASENPHDRLRCLQREGTVPKHAKLTIILEATRQECLALEKQLRPRPNIGWNKQVGGVAPFPHKRGLAPINHDFRELSFKWLEHDLKRRGLVLDWEEVHKTPSSIYTATGSPGSV
jgi:hypothetical protein